MTIINLVDEIGISDIVFETIKNMGIVLITILCFSSNQRNGSQIIQLQERIYTITLKNLPLRAMDLCRIRKKIRFNERRIERLFKCELFICGYNVEGLSNSS